MTALLAPPPLWMFNSWQKWTNIKTVHNKYFFLQWDKVKIFVLLVIDSTFSLLQSRTQTGWVRGSYVLRTQNLPKLFCEYFPFATSELCKLIFKRKMCWIKPSRGGGVRVMGQQLLSRPLADILHGSSLAKHQPQFYSAVLHLPLRYSDSRRRLKITHINRSTRVDGSSSSFS